jgi:hypothetical protein
MTTKIAALLDQMCAGCCGDIGCWRDIWRVAHKARVSSLLLGAQLAPLKILSRDSDLNHETVGFKSGRVNVFCADVAGVEGAKQVS